MSEQEQIDYLKRELHQLRAVVGYLLDAKRLAEQMDIQPPICPDCSITMYDSQTCQKRANDCPMGIGGAK